MSYATQKGCMVQILKQTCNVCNGDGRLEISRDGIYDYVDKCSSCNGRGYKLIVYDDENRLGEILIK